MSDKSYRASISIEMNETDIAQENEERHGAGDPLLTEEDIREEIGGQLFEIVQEMVLGRQAFDFDFSVESRVIVERPEDKEAA